MGLPESEEECTRSWAGGAIVRCRYKVVHKWQNKQQGSRQMSMYAKTILRPLLRIVLLSWMSLD